MWDEGQAELKRNKLRAAEREGNVGLAAFLGVPPGVALDPERGGVRIRGDRSPEPPLLHPHQQQRARQQWQQPGDERSPERV